MILFHLLGILVEVFTDSYSGIKLLAKYRLIDFLGLVKTLANRQLLVGFFAVSFLLCFNLHCVGFLCGPNIYLFICFPLSGL